MTETELSEPVGFWTMNAYELSSDSVWFVSTSIDFRGGEVYYTMAGRAVNGTKPVVFLKSSTQFISGTGTKNDPYMIKE